MFACKHLQICLFFVLLTLKVVDFLSFSFKINNGANQPFFV